MNKNRTCPHGQVLQSMNKVLYLGMGIYSSTAACAAANRC